MEENKPKQKPKSPIKKSQKKLPIWIEILFVQIGLPEKLLVKFLALEKNTKSLINSQRNKYKYILLFGIILLYFYPIIRESIVKNECIESTSKSIGKNTSLPNARSKAINYCNGGNSIDI